MLDYGRNINLASARRAVWKTFRRTTMPARPVPAKGLLLLLIVLTALGEVSTQLILPGLGLIESALGARAGAGLPALSVFVAAFGLGQLFVGPLSDRIGRRPVLIAGLTIYLLATLL